MSIRARSVVALLGPSGSGKSTLLKSSAVFSTVRRVDGTRWRIGSRGWPLAEIESAGQLRLDKIGFIFQFHNLIPSSMPPTMSHWCCSWPGQMRRCPPRAVELLDYLEVGHRRNAMPAKLSGGEAQRIAIARALANRPRIILADEPTAALDSKRAGIVMDLLRTVAVEQEAAIIAVTHDEKIFDRFDRIFQLRDGRLDAGTGEAEGEKPKLRA